LPLVWLILYLLTGSIGIETPLKSATKVVKKWQETGNAATGGWRGQSAPSNGHWDKDCADGSGTDSFEWDDTLYGPVPGPVYHF